MERYTMIKEVGSGTYGSVWKALCKHSGEVVAIKKMKRKYYSWEECLNLREVMVLRKLNHPNIIKLKDVIREHSVLYFIFEYMEHDLFHIMKARGRAFSEAGVRNLVFQVFQGLAHLHELGYFHRDLKPENLLVSNDHVKIADFGLAREFDAQPPFTEYVATRWYRAPEIMLRSPEYGPPADMWAMGVIMAELFTFRPLLPGSSEADQLYKICCFLGSPTGDVWPAGLELASAINYQFPQATGVLLSSLIPNASKDAIDLIASLCSWDPLKRPRAKEALQHPFFQSCFYVPAPLHSKPVFATTPPISVGATRFMAQERDMMPDPASLLKPPAVLSSLFSTKLHAPLISGVQRKLDLNNYNVNPNDKIQINFMKQPSKNYPPRMDDYHGYVEIGRGVQDAAKRLEKLTIGTGELSTVLPPINAGGWDKQPDLFNQQRKELLAGHLFG